MSAIGLRANLFAQRIIQLFARWITACPAEAYLFLLPFALLAYDISWIYPRPDTVDPWMYVGYFLSPRLQIHSFPFAYHGTRLPIILPGYCCFKLFKPGHALVLLHLSLFSVSTWSLYFTVRNLFDRRTAILSGLLLGSNAMFISVMGLTHADSFGVTYALLTIALVTFATKGRFWIPILFFAGFASALFLFTNLAYLPALVAFPWLLTTLPRDKTRKPLPAGMVSVIAGVFTCTFAMCAINKSLGGPWIFFIPWVRAMVGMLPHTNVCATNDFSWIFHATWLVFPGFFFIAVIVAWRTGFFARNTPSDSTHAVLGSFILVSIALVGFESLNFIHYLQFSFYASLLIPTLFLTISAFLSRFVVQWSQETWRYAVIVCFALGVAVLAPINGNAMRFSNVWLLPATGLCAAFALLIRPTFLTQHLGAVAIGFLCISNIFVSNSFDRFLQACPLERKHVDGMDYVGDWRDPMIGRVYLKSTPNRRLAFRVVTAAYLVLCECDPFRQFHFWYDVREPYGPIFTALSSTYLWDIRYVSPHFPYIENVLHQPSTLPEYVERICILSHSSRNVVDEARNTLKSINKAVIVHYVLDFTESHGLPMKLTFIRLVEPNSPELAKRG